MPRATSSACQGRERRGGSGTRSEQPRGQGRWRGCSPPGLPRPGRVGAQAELLHQLHLGGVVEEGNQGLHLGGVGTEAGVVRVEDLPLFRHAGQHPGLEEGHLARRAQLRQDHLGGNPQATGSATRPAPRGDPAGDPHPGVGPPTLGSSWLGEQRRPVACREMQAPVSPQ